MANRARDTTVGVSMSPVCIVAAIVSVAIGLFLFLISFGELRPVKPDHESDDNTSHEGRRQQSSEYIHLGVTPV